MVIYQCKTRSSAVLQEIIVSFGCKQVFVKERKKATFFG